MTVITYRNGMMAADRNVTTDEDLIVGTHIKIKKMGGTLAGGAGNSEDCEAFFSWIENGGNAPIGLAPRFIGIMVRPDGSVHCYNGGLIEVGLEAEYYAIGSGDAVALGAFFAGADAETAAKAACAHTMGCGGGIDVIQLDDIPSAQPPASGGTVGS